MHLALALCARDLIEPFAPPREVALIYHWLSNSYWMICKCREELSAAEKALAHAHQSGDPLIIQVEELAERTSHAIGIAWSHAFRGLLAFYEGVWEHARASFAESIDKSRVADILQHLPHCLFFFGRLSYLCGDPEQGANYQQQGMALAEQHSLVWPYWPCQGVLAEQDLLEGHPETAAQRLQWSLEKLGDDAPFDMLPLPPPLAQAYLTMGQEVEAEATVTRAIERASEMGHRLVLVDALRVRAMISTRQQRWEEATAAFEEALALARAMPYPYAEAKALYVYGQLHAAKGEPEQAREKYQAALAIGVRLGERPYAERIEHALQELPHP